MSATPLTLLLDIAGRLARRGLDKEMDGLHLFVIHEGRKVEVACAQGERVKIITPLVWDGHEHSPAGGLPPRIVTPGSRAADPIQLAADIRKRLDARAAALAQCLHSPSSDGVCPECDRPLPVVPEGAREAIADATAEMHRRGVMGSLRLHAVGASLRVVWVSGSGSRSDVTYEALAVAVAHLRAAGLTADVAPGLAFAVVDALPAAEQRTALDGGEVEPRSETERECAHAA